jgi:hypothetical protein
MGTMRLDALAAALVVTMAGPAAAEDPLRSAGCTAALTLLQDARSAAEASSRVESLRHSAARSCLGLGDPPARPSRTLQSPVAVPPPAITPPGPPAVLATPAPLPAPVHIDRPPAVTSCDANGCWANDGNRLQRVNPQQVGPRGPCAVQAGVLLCP